MEDLLVVYSWNKKGQGVELLTVGSKVRVSNVSCTPHGPIEYTHARAPVKAELRFESKIESWDGPWALPMYPTPVVLRSVQDCKSPQTVTLAGVIESVEEKTIQKEGAPVRKLTSLTIREGDAAVVIEYWDRAPSANAKQGSTVVFARVKLMPKNGGQCCTHAVSAFLAHWPLHPIVGHCCAPLGAHYGA
jgi:hypothetical protein